MRDDRHAALVTALFTHSLALYRQGALAESERALGKVLELEPGHFDTLHLCGVIAAQSGRPERAVELIQRALRTNANVAAAHRHLGNSLRDLRRFEEALGSYTRAIALRADFKEAHVNRAMLQLTLCNAAAALTDFDRALALGADDAQVHTFRASALINLARPAEAIASCDLALACDPDFAFAYINRAAACYVLGHHQQALESADKAIRLRPDDGDAHRHRGAALYALRRLDEALDSLDRAIILRPDSAFAHNLRALCLLDLQRPMIALESAERASTLRPELADAHNTRGLALAELGQIDAAMASFDRAIALQPQLSEPLFNKGLRYLQSGDFERGFELYERRPMADRGAAVGGDAPRWDGSGEIAGKRFLTYAEQGLGDTVQFSRYALLLAARGARVVLSVQDGLCALLRSLGSNIEVIGATERPTDIELQCPLLSLPHVFGTRIETIPAPCPYLQPQPERVARWRERLGTGGRLIGIHWQGSTGRADAGRSFALRYFASIAGIPGVRLISLQKGPGTEQLRDMPGDWRVEDLGPQFGAVGAEAFLDTAAVIAAVDLVITSDTFIAHLAGALGRPTWVALKHRPDWRWLLEREDCPWYPTMRLFRQPEPGAWAPVFDRMRRELEGG
ncbi:MAG: tetratricopeptide repeat protein [Steroidobacteraceae bacterium]